MDVIGSEIGHKMRSAIKAKLTELGCYVDDELPDYVMVMVANKRTRSQMEEDLQLFLGDNTELFVNWLHQVLRKLQEVTVTAPRSETEKSKDKSAKEKKSKDKKEKHKKGESSKKSKKKDKSKDKIHRKKNEKKSHKKKKSKHEMLRPNIPPLLMNIEKESEPSITDVFAGQILKTHGFLLDIPKDDAVDKKPSVTEIVKVGKPIIDPASISSQLPLENIDADNISDIIDDNATSSSTEKSTDSTENPREEQLKEMNEIEAKIIGLKQKLTEQLDSMSDDEDFLNIRTEAEELMNDFAEDVLQEISQPVALQDKLEKIVVKPKSPETKQEMTKEILELPHIELKLPIRPLRERLGAKEVNKTDIEKIKDIGITINNNVAEAHVGQSDSPERFTPEREPEFRPSVKSAKSRLGEPSNKGRKSSTSGSESDNDFETSKRKPSRPSKVSCASVVRVRPRPRVHAPSNSLLLRAVADAHKSLLSIPPKDSEPKIKRALVLPMRRCVDAEKIVIQVRGNNEKEDTSDNTIPHNKDFLSTTITKRIINTDYVPPSLKRCRSPEKEDTIDVLNIHTPATTKEKNTQFIVTMDGFNPNAFLAKKLLSEGLLDAKQAMSPKIKPSKSVLRSANALDIDTREIVADDNITKLKEDQLESNQEDRITPEIDLKTKEAGEKTPENMHKINMDDTSPKPTPTSLQKKRLSDTSEESDTHVILNVDDKPSRRAADVVTDASDVETSRPKKRKASPIVFDKVESKKDASRKRTESASSDNTVTVTTAVNSNKYESLPPLTQSAGKTVWCRSFPSCRYGASCAFAHPRCRFGAHCERRLCAYSHSADTPLPVAPTVASLVVATPTYKTMTPVSRLCKYYPSCSNTACHFAHPKPCRFGDACTNKIECNFHHADMASTKYRYHV